MAKISTYSDDINVEPNDRIIGTNSETGFTNNYSIGSIFDFFLKEKGRVQSVDFVYSFAAKSSVDVENGEISTDNFEIGLSSGVSNIFASKNTLYEISVEPFIELTASNSFKLLMVDISNYDNFAFFDTLSVSDVNETTLDISVTPIISNGFFAEGQTVGLKIFPSSLSLSDIFPANDNVPLVKNFSDNTKQLIIDLSDVSSGVTRNIFMPDEDVDLSLVNTALQSLFDDTRPELSTDFRADGNRIFDVRSISFEFPTLSGSFGIGEDSIDALGIFMDCIGENFFINRKTIGNSTIKKWLFDDSDPSLELVNTDRVLTKGEINTALSIIDVSGFTGSLSAGNGTLQELAQSVDDMGSITSNPVAFSGLPITPSTGSLAVINDGSSVTYRAIASGGGSSVALVLFDGTDWIYS